jgi:hypothetical protein
VEKNVEQHWSLCKKIWPNLTKKSSRIFIWEAWSLLKLQFAFYCTTCQWNMTLPRKKSNILVLCVSFNNWKPSLCYIRIRGNAKCTITLYNSNTIHSRWVSPHTWVSSMIESCVQVVQELFSDHVPKNCALDRKKKVKYIFSSFHNFIFQSLNFELHHKWYFNFEKRMNWYLG